jgi:carbamoyltransferase
MQKEKIIWGASGLSHDAAIAVVKDGKLIFASSAERYSRVKNDPNFNIELIADCLEYGKPDIIVWYEKPFKKFLRRLVVDKLWQPYSVKKTFEMYRVNAPIQYVDHHVSHLCASLYTAPFNTDKTLGLVVDSVGEFKTLSVWDIDNGNYKCVHSRSYPNSLGLFYSSITDMLGLKAQEEEYIMMGMAAYGTSNWQKYYNFFIENLFDKNYNLILDLRRGCKGLLSQEEIEVNKFDIALAAQKIYEDVVVSITTEYLNKTGYKKLVFSGGCALNCTANTFLLELVDEMHIFPNPGDSGSAVGAALAHLNRPVELNNLYLGHNASTNIDIGELVNYLDSNKMAGVIFGKAEFGPRALGHRSILADPRVPNIKDIVNEVKGREKFRPFAPIILKEHFNEVFYNKGKTNSYPYMQFTHMCKQPELYPGIVHVDNSSRVQTVDVNTPFIHQVLQRWYDKTGCPVLLNTSLNIKGKPLLNDVYNINEFNRTKLKIFGN